MSVILAPRSTGSTNPIFKSRNLPGYTQGALNTLPHIAIPTIREVAYAGYKSNIDVFVAATNRQMKLLVSAPGARVSNLDRPSLPLRMPKVAFIMEKGISRDQEDVLMAKLESMGVERNRQGKTTVFILHTPRRGVLTFLNANAQKHIQAPADTISHLAYEALLFMRLVVAEFLATNTYPATVDTMDVDDDRGVDDLLDERMHASLDGASAHEAMIETEASRDRREAIEKHNQERAEGTEPEPMVEAVMQKILRIASGPTSELVLTAKPSPLPASFNYGPVSSVPHLPGMAFPYFDGMNSPDRTTIRSIFLGTFFRTMGDSMQACQDVFHDMKKAIDGLTNSREGKEMAHILCGVKYALDAQARLFLIIDGDEYNGFVLLGGLWSLFDGTEWLQPQSPDKLAETLSSLASHSSSVMKLAQVLSQLSLKQPLQGQEKKDVTVDDLKRSSDLWRELNMRKIGGDAKKEIQGALGMLAYTRSYRQVNVDSIIWAIQHMTIKADDPLDADIARFIPPSLEHMDDKVMEVLCTFGPDAFSFINANGTKYVIPFIDSTAADANEAVSVGTKKYLWAFAVATKGVSVAYLDMKRMMAKKEVVMDLGERASRNRCAVFTGAARDQLYQALKECIGGKSGDVLVERPGKRKLILGDGDEDGSRPKTFQDALLALEGL